MRLPRKKQPGTIRLHRPHKVFLWGGRALQEGWNAATKQRPSRLLIARFSICLFCITDQGFLWDLEHIWTKHSHIKRLGLWKPIKERCSTMYIQCKKKKNSSYFRSINSLALSVLWLNVAVVWTYFTLCIKYFLWPHTFPSFHSCAFHFMVHENLIGELATIQTSWTMFLIESKVWTFSKLWCDLL